MASEASDEMDIKGDLLDCLEVIDSGNWATSGPLSNANNPGLFVNGIGKIGLPLSDRDAVELCRVSHEAPPGKGKGKGKGKGSETSVDPTVRKTWELRPKQFEMRNPAWRTTVDEIVRSVAQELGVVGGAFGVRAEMGRLLLYGPGAFMDKHRKYAASSSRLRLC